MHSNTSQHRTNCWALFGGTCTSKWLFWWKLIHSAAYIWWYNFFYNVKKCYHAFAAKIIWSWNKSHAKSMNCRSHHDVSHIWPTMQFNRIHRRENIFSIHTWTESRRRQVFLPLYLPLSLSLYLSQTHSTNLNSRKLKLILSYFTGNFLSAFHYSISSLLYFLLLPFYIAYWFCCFFSFYPLCMYCAHGHTLLRRIQEILK